MSATSVEGARPYESPRFFQNRDSAQNLSKSQIELLEHSMTDADAVAINQLTRDAHMVMARCLESLDGEAAATAAAGITAGGGVEIRLLFRAGRMPRIGLHLVSDTGEIELVSAGGQQS